MMIKKLLLAGPMVLFFGSAMAFMVMWTAPSQREDNSVLSLSEIAGYMIYCGPEIGNYDISIPVLDPTATSAVLATSDLPLGVNYCVMTTLDTDARESLYSNVIAVDMVLDKANPKPPYIPVGTKITVTVPLP